jgi:hypothetical protein
VLTICLGKSTYARCGIIVNVTPFEPEWEGFVTLEISNTTPLPARIYANEGIAQVLFFEADEVCDVSYADKKGKYQKQQSIVLPKLWLGPTAVQSRRRPRIRVTSLHHCHAGRSTSRRRAGSDGLDTFLLIHEGKHDQSGNEEEDQGENGRPEVEEDLIREPEYQRSNPGCSPVADLIERVELRLAPAWNQL